MGSLLRIGKRKVFGLLFAVLVALVAYLAWDTLGLEGLVVVTLLTVLVGLGAVGFMVAAAERRIRGEIAFFVYTTRDLIHEMKESAPRPGEHDEALLRALSASYRRLEQEIVRQLKESD